MEKKIGTAKINDRLRKAMSTGQVTIELSEMVSQSQNRIMITKAIREYDTFDPEIDVSGDHSIGVVVVEGEGYVFRFTYIDERYDYSREVGKRVLKLMHLSEFRSLKLGQKIRAYGRKMVDQGK